MSRGRLAALGLVLALVAACGPSEPEPTAAPPEPAPAPTPPPEPSAGQDRERAGEAGEQRGEAERRSEDSAVRGETTYATYCASCHGPRGEGDGPLAATLDPQPAKHSDAAYMNALSDEHLFRVVKEGGPAVGKSPLMAPWGGTLSDQEIRDLVAFMRSLTAS